MLPQLRGPKVARTDMLPDKSSSGKDRRTERPRAVPVVPAT
jgi:hypothetical protein